MLHYEKITIRNALPEDAPLLARWWNDGAVMAHAGFPKGLGTAAEKIAAGLADDTDETRRRMILLRDATPHRRNGLPKYWQPHCGHRH
ncbi:MAG: hypothetical protein Q4D50_09785 [Eubacteriales bacterium]|nr:hypothetical protein [Eubacteriales bacterium]